jgi:hypothetical protein
VQGGGKDLTRSDVGELRKGINEPDRITVLQQSGEIDIMDQNYKPIPNAKARPEHAKSAMEGMGRFYAR